MSLESIFGVDLNTAFETPAITSALTDESDSILLEETQSKSVFESLFDSALQMVNDANEYSNAAEEEEIKYALGETDSIHDLRIAQQKANISLQYTVAVRDAFMTGYREIMNLQF